MCDRDIRNCVCAGKRPCRASRCRRCLLQVGGRLPDRLLLRCECRAAGFFRTGAFVLQSGTGGALYGGLLPELCISCAYGFAFLLLSTSYLGFLLIPVVFGVKGFLSACTAAAFLRSGCAHAFALSCVAVGLPGLFLVPALFLLGVLCAQMSVRLLEQRRGLPVPVSSERYSRELRLCSACCWRLRPPRAMQYRFSHGLFCDLWSLWMKSDWKGGSRRA